MQNFDRGHDHQLSLAEMAALLGDNGVKLSQDQVGQVFGRFDSAGDGFDGAELAQVLSVVGRLPAVSERLRAASDAGSVVMDVVIICAAGLGLAYLVLQSDQLEKKWAANSFRGAVTNSRLQAKCSNLDTEISKLHSERLQLEEEIRALESNHHHQDQDKTMRLRRLGSRLHDVKQLQDQKKHQLETEVQKWQEDAKRSMLEASLAKSKMERVMSCIKGIDSFAGRGTGKFAGAGAQLGFAVKQPKGFALDSITFGTIEDGHLHLFETSTSWKLGEGRDCAFKCKDIDRGTEWALKMYKIENPEQRQSIQHDLFAYRSQVGQHERIVSYERVIESESTIFVLMELIKGKDLFDIVASQVLTEHQVRLLFKQLLAALMHLHENGVIHCDVKPENAMVVGDIAAGTAQLKLIDFGCSCFTRYDDDTRSCVVWDSYMPPEHAAQPSRAPAVSTDMWRLGCTLYVMLVRRPPFNNDAQTRTGQQLRQAGSFYRVPEYEALSAEAKDLLTQLICGDPSKRASAERVLEHPWLSLDS